MTMGNDLLVVRDLTLEVVGSGTAVVNGISFSIDPGEIVGIVGESGAGKTLAARALLGLTPQAICRTRGSIRFENEEITSMTSRRLRALRGARIGMVFQDPLTSLNPSMPLGEQLGEGLALHRQLKPAERRALILDMLRRVGLGDPEQALIAYPHQFSGGMRQRIMLASVMLLKPALLVADEPTTALDGVVQRDVLELMVALTREHNTAILMISHDLGVVARYCDRIIVMYRGEIVEEGRSQNLLAAPRHPYTRKLLAAMPRRGPSREFPAGETPVVAVRRLVVDYPGRWALFRRRPGKRALNGVNLQVAPRQVVAVIGGSGAGKTTLGHAVAGLIRPVGGTILFDGRPVGRRDTGYWNYRLNCQMVFQDPYSSLDPRMTVGGLVAEPLRFAEGMTPGRKGDRAREVLIEVGLGDGFASRYPHELSSGQRQRVAIARALVRRPKFVIADEPLSSLDVTVRAQILQLFARLQARHHFSCLFISHDLGVVEQVADRVVVLNDGRIVEEGARDEIFDAPKHPYTRRLLSAVPVLDSTPDGGVCLAWRLDGERAAEEPLKVGAT
jgi:peptide/nickel transport system ATP-binding protein